MLWKPQRWESQDGIPVPALSELIDVSVDHRARNVQAASFLHVIVWVMRVVATHTPFKKFNVQPGENLRKLMRKILMLMWWTLRKRKIVKRKVWRV